MFFIYIGRWRKIKVKSLKPSYSRPRNCRTHKQREEGQDRNGLRAFTKILAHIHPAVITKHII